MKFAHAILLGALVTTVVPVQVESDDGPTLAEAKAAFSQADAELNRAYREVKELLPDWLFDELRAEQKEWLEYRDAAALSDTVFNGGREYDGRETEAPAYWVSLTRATVTRTDMILGWKAKGKEGAGMIPWAGFWSDGQGGWLLIEEILDPKRVRFRMQVVRGPTAHIGGISGIARRNGEAGFFTDEGDPDLHDEDEKAETWLFFEKDFGTPRIEVRGIHTQPYHGARAYFDGTYTRLRDATDEDRAIFDEP